jgi:molybdenum-dependent DNA-binding transcriptional regulator ModE
MAERSNLEKVAPDSGKGNLETLVGFFSGGNKGIGARITKAYETMIKGYEIINEGYKVVLKGTQDLSRFYFELAQELAQAYKRLLRQLSQEQRRAYA